jgi:hypothetical protein
MAVKTVTGPDGTRYYGEDVEGIFIPFASVSAARVGHLVERGKDLGEKLKSNDADEVRRAQEAVDSLPISSSGRKNANDDDKANGGDE